jgi:NAD(P)-dependent dehydrogenase (short-subunit alcohol dehydrogenase family)
VGRAERSDVSDPTDTERLVDATVARFEGLDVLCNPAGVSASPRRILDDDLRDLPRVFSVDLYGLMQMTRTAALYMEDHGGGSIVDVSSAGGTMPGVGMPPYRAAKAGVRHFGRCVAVELGEHGIRVNCVTPANIATDSTPRSMRRQ